MILDQQLVFSDAQTLTASAASSNVICTNGAKASQLATNFLGASGLATNLGSGEPMVIALFITSVSGTTPTLTAKLQGDTAEGFGTAVDIQTFLPAAVTPVASTRMVEKLNPSKWFDYFRLYYTLTGSNLSIVVSAFLLKEAEIQAYTQYY